MSKEKTYRALARLLEYPQDKDALLAESEQVARFLTAAGLAAASAPFAEFLRTSSLSSLQEDYVANFDFNPAKAPYLGHHLYGDNQRKAAYMIGIKEQFARFRFSSEGCELPDHLTVLLGFLAHLVVQGEDGPRRQFIEESVLPGVQKILAGGERAQSPWRPVIHATAIVLTADWKEGSGC
jgi:nitrate reductase molybdenum cofactor assembly chaperone NarJ/NarW